MSISPTRSRSRADRAPVGAPAAEPLLDPAEFRPPGGALGEMHAHSVPRSRDSGVRPGVLAAQAVLIGLDFVVLTEHNAIWPPDELRVLSEESEILLLRGMELGTDLGHVLVYGLDHYSLELLSIRHLRSIVKAEGAAMALAHPMRPLSSGRSPSWEEISELFDGIEVVNGDHGNPVDGYYSRLAADLGVAAIGGSDVHSREAVGRVVTAFPGSVRDLDSLVRFILEQRVYPVDLRP